METINKWTEHVVRDFLQERENRATVICSIQYCTAAVVCGIETIVIILQRIHLNANLPTKTIKFIGKWTKQNTVLIYSIYYNPISFKCINKYISIIV